MQWNKELRIDYQPFHGSRAMLHVQPYAMKVYHQRWYIVGFLKEQKGIRNIALDRIFTSQLLAMGEKVEVLEPVELREEIKNRLLNTLNRYHYE